MSDQGHMTWGSSETQYFFELTPEKILDAVEASGLPCTGRCLTLNSMENRVYEVELELDEKPKNRSDKFRIVKFYRPGRWTEAQILEEHEFLNDLVKDEIPAVAPLPFSDGKTLHKMKDIDLWYTVFPKVGGRNPDEMTSDQIDQFGRLMARLHAVGDSKKAQHRIRIDPMTYGRGNLKFLLDSKTIPLEYESRYKGLVEQICDLSEPWFENVHYQRIHGDCHLGNLLWGEQGPFLVDFDDMVQGPPVQDIWLMLPGRDEESIQKRAQFLDAYELMREFDHGTLRLIEPLRALRFVHFTAWIAKRWSDPVFPRTFINFGTPRYWEEQINDLTEQLRLIQGSSY